MNQFMLKSSFAAVLLACVGAASAGNATSNLAVTATVSANCTIATAPVAFGTAYDTVAGTAVNATGSVSIACTKGAAPNVTLGMGANAAGSTRRMSDGGTNFLTYELYQQPSTTVPNTACNYTAPTVWGTTGANIFTPSVSPGKASRTYNVCGQIPGAQDVAAAVYSDLVVATINF